MNVEEAYSIVSSHLKLDSGRFYGPAGGLSLGTGLIYDEVEYIYLDAQQNEYVIVRGLNYILSHECDIEQGNQRPLNERVVICPIIPFDQLVSDYQNRLDENVLRNFLDQLAQWEVYRAIYFPIIPDVLPRGGILYLNFITNTHVSFFSDEGAFPVCALSAYGLNWIDWAIQRHLLRPKDESLPFT